MMLVLLLHSIPNHSQSDCTFYLIIVASPDVVEFVFVKNLVIIVVPPYKGSVHFLFSGLGVLSE